MEFSTLVKILTSNPMSGRYIAMQAHQAKSAYAKQFGTPVPEWVESEAHGHIASLCNEAIKSKVELPLSKPSQDDIQTFLANERDQAKQLAFARWGATPADFGDKLRGVVEGSYNELLEAVIFLEQRITECRKAADPEGVASWEKVEIELFGDADRLFEVAESGWYEFSASRMDGPNIDVFEVSGLPWTEDINDRVWGNTNWEELLRCCPEVDLQEEETIDEVPGQSDTYFTVSIHDPRQFARELRAAMLSYTVYSDDLATR